MRAETKDAASNETTQIAPTPAVDQRPSENEFKRLAKVQKKSPVLGYLEAEEEPCELLSENELARVQKKSPVLGYLEEEEASRHDNSVEGHADAVPPPAPRRRPARTRAQAPAGAYSGAEGEEYQILRKVENCAEHLGGVSSNEEHPTNGNALEATLEPGNSTKGWQQKQLIVIGLAIASLLVALSIAIPVALLQRGSSEDPAITERGIQKEKPKTIHDIDFRALIPNITNTTINTIVEDPFSQQFQAYKFISWDPDWNSYEDWRKQQRFAVACYLYAFQDENFNVPLHGSHECKWVRSKICNDMGKVTSLKITSSPFGARPMKGTIPPEISFLSHMERLDIHQVKVGNMEKAFPIESFQALNPMLKELRLHGADLEGTMPSSVGLLTGLTSLDLSKNDLTGSIPEEIGNLPNLTIFSIEDNSDLEDSLPAAFCSDDRLLPWDTLLTDWCGSAEECCGTS